MRVSCNGCRILRKGCSEDCSIRPCLEWIKSGESQANATVFLAKFYGRAGLLNLLNAGPEHIRPAIFRSLLYEACGRIINPIYGSVGLLWSGRWQLCQAAVEAILRGDPITPIPAESDSKLSLASLHKASSYDIRHISRALDLKRVNKRTLFKRPGDKGSSTIQWMDHGRELQGGERGKEVMISMERRKSEVELELTLGYESVHHGHSPFRGSSSSSSS